MTRQDENKLLSQAIEGLVDAGEEGRVRELLATDPASKSAYEEARTAH